MRRLLKDRLWSSDERLCLEVVTKGEDMTKSTAPTSH